MTYLEAALAILNDSEVPLSTREITERALKAQLLVARGSTPDATMRAALYQALGADHSLFKLAERGNGRARPGTVLWTVRQG